MDILRLEITEGLDIFEEPAEEVEVFVNDRNLKDLVREVELPFATRDGNPGLAGSYAGLPPEAVFLSSRRLLGEPSVSWDDRGGRIAVLGCGCGVVGCWPFMVEIAEIGDQMIWSDYHQPHRRRWDHDLLGTFKFDRAQYLDQLRRTGDKTVQYG